MAITNKDIEKLKDVFATKADLENLKFELKNEFLTKSEYLSSFDKIMKKLQDMSIEMKMFLSSSRRHGDELEDHEKRIKIIETKVLVS